jgi:hypothetical protein
MIGWWLSAAVVASVAGCAWARNAAHRVAPQPDPPESIRWNGVLFVPTDTLADTASMPYGTAWMAPVAPNNVIRARVAVERARPGAQFTWRVHLGSCARDRGVFGPDTAYATIVADSSGSAAGIVQIALGFPNSGAYFVRVDAVDSGPPALLCGTLINPS